MLFDKESINSILHCREGINYLREGINYLREGINYLGKCETCGIVYLDLN